MDTINVVYLADDRNPKIYASKDLLAFDPVKDEIVLTNKVSRLKSEWAINR